MALETAQKHAMPPAVASTEPVVTAAGVKKSGAATNVFLIHWCGRSSVIRSVCRTAGR